MTGTGGEKTPRRINAFVGAALPLALALVLALDLRRGTGGYGVPVWQLVLVIVLCVGVASRWRISSVLNPVSLYAIVFSVFHLGLLILVEIWPDVRFRMGDYPTQWLGTELSVTAASLAATGLVAFTAAAALLSWRTPDRPGRTVQTPVHAGVVHAGVVGLAMVLAGAAMWTVQISLVGGWGAEGQYLRLLESSQTALSAYGTLLLGLGLPLTVLGGRRVRVAGIVVFAVFALGVFPLGLRGTVLFPLVAWLAARYLAGRRPRYPLIAATGAGLLAVSGYVRASRVGNADMVSPTGILDSVVATLAEIGGSIYTVVLAQQWRLLEKPATDFSSFVIVPLRFLEDLFVPGGAPPGDQDLRIFNVRMTTLAGPFGGSPVAEAHLAGGWPGVVLVMAVLGGVVGMVVRQAGRSPAALPYAVVILFPIFLNIRNSFAPVPLQVAVGVLVILGLHLVARRTAPAASPDRTSASPAPRPRR